MRPEWGAPSTVGAWMSTRQGGVSPPPFDSLDLQHAGATPHGTWAAADLAAPAALADNRRRFAAQLEGAAPVWLQQVHGADVLRLDGVPAEGAALPRADASATAERGIACCVLVADCLPVLLCDAEGRAVGAAHAGWRGLAAGVLERTVAAVCALAGCGPARLSAWLGPCIGPRRFEVGADVLQAFEGDEAFFSPRPRPDGAPRWLADLPGLARARLARCGVVDVAGGQWCTVEDASRFFSFRRDGRTGRMAAAVWRR